MKSNKVTRGILAIFVMMLFCFAFTGVASASEGYDGVPTTMGHADETIRVVMINSSSQTVNLLNPYGWGGTKNINRTTLGFSEKGPNPQSIDIPPLNAKSFEVAFNGYSGGFDMPIGFNGSSYYNVKLSILPTVVIDVDAIVMFAVHFLHAALDVTEFVLEPGDPLAVMGLVKNVLEMTKEATDFGNATTYSMLMANNGSIIKNQTGQSTNPGNGISGWPGNGVYWIYGGIGKNHRLAAAPTRDLNGGYGFPMVGVNGNQGMVFDVVGGTDRGNDPTGKKYATLFITIHDDNSFNKAMNKYNQDNNGNLGFTWDLRNCHPKTDFGCNLSGTACGWGFPGKAWSGPFFFGDNDTATDVTANVGAKMSVLPTANGMSNSGTVIFRNFTPFMIKADSQIIPMTVGPASYGGIWAGEGGLAANGGQAAYSFGFSKNDPNYFWIVNFGIQDSTSTKFKFDLRPTLSGGNNTDLQNAWTKLSRQIATTNAPPGSPDDAFGQLKLAMVIPSIIINSSATWVNSSQNIFMPNTNTVSGMIYSPNDFFGTVGSGTNQMTFTYKDTDAQNRDHVAVTDGNYVYQTITVNSATPYMLVNVYTVAQWAAISNPSWQPPAPPTPPAAPTPPALKKASTPTEPTTPTTLQQPPEKKKKKMWWQ